MTLPAKRAPKADDPSTYAPGNVPTREGGQSRARVPDPSREAMRAREGTAGDEGNAE